MSVIWSGVMGVCFMSHWHFNRKVPDSESNSKSRSIIEWQPEAQSMRGKYSGQRSKMQGGASDRSETQKYVQSREVQVVSPDSVCRKTPWTLHRPDWETGLGQRVKGLGIQSSSENTAKTAHTDRYWTEVSKADTPVSESDKYSMLGLLLIKWQILSVVQCSFELMWPCCFNDFTFQNTDHLIK